MAERTCRICDAPITDRSFHPEGWKQRTCSMECLRTHWRLKAQRKAGTKTKTDGPCLTCGEPTGVSPGRGRGRLYCPPCASARQVGALAVGWCVDCDAMVQRRRARCPTCSAHREADRLRARRAARLDAVKCGEDVRLNLLAQRDRFRCQLCGRKVDMTRHTSRARHDPLSPSVDHIVPLSEGGEHTMANAQLAHLGCNMTKGARPAGEQLRLVG